MGRGTDEDSGEGRAQPCRARVVVLAGPSGAGKSRLAERSGLPVLRLDDFYREGDEPGLPRIASGANSGLVDWDHPASWDHDAALAAMEALSEDGRAEVPVYDLASSARTGVQVLDLHGSALFAAEGIFAAEVVEECRSRGLLAAAFCVTQHPLVTFARRLQRDLRERRKPPLVLLRRGLALLRDQPRVVARTVAVGCEPLTGDEGLRRLRGLEASRSGHR